MKPSSSANKIKLNEGVIPVAVLSDGGFDATTVDPMSARLGYGAATESHGRGHVDDVDRDGDDDLVLHFDREATGIGCGSTSVLLIATTIDGQAVEGWDQVSVLGCGR